MVETGDGIKGVGESTLDYRSSQVCAGIEAAAHCLKGHSRVGIERIWSDLHDRIFWRGGPADMAVLSAIDQASGTLQENRLVYPSIYDWVGRAAPAFVRASINGGAPSLRGRTWSIWHVLLLRKARQR